MNKFVNEMGNIFYTLFKHPERDEEISEIIKETLNNEFLNKYDIGCKKVFISKGNDSNPYVISVIPTMPNNNILNHKFLKTYDIDIDFDNFIDTHNYNGFNAEELSAWLIHEIAANLITDTTLLRYKKLLIKYYDTNNSSIMNTISSLGILLWIGIFSRTKKEFVEETNIGGEVDAILQTYDVIDDWNNALMKYVCNIGGTYEALSDEYILRMDKTHLRKFNELARKYSAYVIKYNNTDYSTMAKYLISTTNSKLIKYYIEKEPQQMVIFKEKDVYNLFDDRKLLLEDAENEKNGTDKIDLFKEKTAAEIVNEYNELELDVNNVTCMSDKLLVSVRLKDLLTAINKRLLEDNTNYSDPSSLSFIREKVNELIHKLNSTDLDEKISVLEVDDTAV